MFEIVYAFKTPLAAADALWQLDNAFSFRSGATATSLAMDAHIECKVAPPRVSNRGVQLDQKTALRRCVLLVLTVLAHSQLPYCLMISIKIFRIGL